MRKNTCEVYRSRPKDQNWAKVGQIGIRTRVWAKTQMGPNFVWAKLVWPKLGFGKHGIFKILVLAKVGSNGFLQRAPLPTAL